MTVNIISLNARGLRNFEKAKQIMEFYRNKCNILCLQETHTTVDCEKIWMSTWGGQILFSHGESNARGIAVLINPSLKCDVSQMRTDTSGRLLMCNLFVEDTYINLNVYIWP